MEPVLRLERAELRRSEGFRLGPVDLVVRPGERVALVGPSGAGKSTLLALASGALAPDGGAVWLDGRRADRLGRRERARLVGLMHQRHDLVEQLRVRHNVQAGLLGRWSSVKALLALVGPVEAPEARRALRRVGLEHALERRTSELSGGEHQRVALARLLVQDPTLMLVDEPVASLDPVHSRELLALLAALVGEGGRALLCSLHQPELALRHLDRIVAMREGRIVADRASPDVEQADLDEVYLSGRG